MFQTRAIFAANDTPYFIVGDGSGGGGGGGGTGAVGGNGGGDDDAIDLSTSTTTNVIFGDGSGGGAGGRSVGYTPDVRGGQGGSGNDTILGGSGNDIFFGDGFDGQDAVDTAFYPGHGGVGGGGGGAAGGNFGMPPWAATGGICGGGGGGGTLNGGVTPLIVACGNSTAGSNASGSSGGAGGNAATTLGLVQGLGGPASSYNGGGGGGFGGARGGYGGVPPENGDTNQHSIEDTGSLIHAHFTESYLRSILTNYRNYGTGSDIINGGGGVNELFGLGGADTFIVDSVDGSTSTRVWDFSAGDELLLKTDGVLIATVDVNSVVSGAEVLDLDGDGSVDDTRITFEGVPIDLVNVDTIQTDESGSLSTPNSPPDFSLADTSLSYTVGAGATQIDSAASLNDQDGNEDWNGGTLKVQIIANSTANDTISVSGSNISITGTTLKYSANPIGLLSVSGGSVTGSTALTITFDAYSDNSKVQAIAQNIRFYTSNAGTADRIVKFTVTDKNGAAVEDTRVIDISAAPSITYHTVSATAGTGGSISPSSRQVADGGVDTFSVSANPGYSISGVTGCGGSLSGQTFTTGTISGDCAVEASFSANNYSLIFNTQGGDAVDTITQAYSSSVLLPNDLKSGYTLSKWNTKSDGTGTDYVPETSISMPVNGLTLYAQWTEGDPPSPSPSPTPSSNPSSDSSNTNSTSQSSSDPKAEPRGCESATLSAPNLFQIDTSQSMATLYFSPLVDTSKYYISYSTQASAEEHGAEVSLGNQGVQQFDVSGLAAGTQYYFKVRGQLDCQPGEWSNIKMAKTSPSNTDSSDLFSENNMLNNDQFDADSDSDQNEEKTELDNNEQASEVGGSSLDLLVTDQNNKPLAGVAVTLHSKIQEGITDENGRVHFDQVEPGDHRIILAYEDFSGEQAINIDGKNKQVELKVEVTLIKTGVDFIWVAAGGLIALSIILLLLWFIYKRKSKKTN